MRIVSALVVVCLVAAAALVVVVGNKPSQEGFSVTLTDALGRQVNLTHAPMRIVSTAPEITELTYALGVGDRLIGVTDYCDFPANVTERKSAGTLKSVGGFWDPKLEDIVNLTPDLVLVSGWNSAHIELANQLDSMGIKSVALYEGTTIDQVYKNVRLVGAALKMTTKADQLVSGMQDTITKIHDKLSPTASKPRVMFIVWLGDPIYVAGNDTFINEVIKFAGGVNAVNTSGWASLSKEDAYAAAPDVIFISGTMAMETPEQLITSLKNDTIWNMTDAVKNDKIYITMNQGENVFVRQSVRIVEAVQLMAEVFQPQQFGVNIPSVIGNEYQSYLVSLDTPAHQAPLAR